MPYCPNCQTEYVEGTTECENCKATLLTGSPPPPERPGRDDLQESADVSLVRVRAFAGPTAVMEAELARNLLETQGITGFLLGENSGEVLPGIDVVQLVVRKEDAGRASEILQGYLETPAPLGPEAGE